MQCKMNPTGRSVAVVSTNCRPYSTDEIRVLCEATVKQLYCEVNDGSQKFNTICRDYGLYSISDR